MTELSTTKDLTVLDVKRMLDLLLSLNPLKTGRRSFLFTAALRRLGLQC